MTFIAFGCESKNLQHHQVCKLIHPSHAFFNSQSPFCVYLSVLQCIDNIRCNGLMMNAFEENSKVTVPQMIK